MGLSRVRAYEYMLGNDERPAMRVPRPRNSLGQREQRFLRGAIAIAIGCLSILGMLNLKSASATVIHTWTPGYTDGYIPNSGSSPCSGVDNYYSATTSSTGQVTSGYQETDSDATGCTPTSGTRTHGGGFHMGSGFSPSSSGTYYLISDWTFSSIEDFVDMLSGCSHGGYATVSGSVILAVWDQTSGTNIAFTSLQVGSYNACTDGWVWSTGNLGQAVVTFGWTAQYNSATFSLSSTHTYEFRSNVNFVTTVNCPNGYCSVADSLLATGTNYSLTLNWEELAQ
jgi:hypothetical protein